MTGSMVKVLKRKPDTLDAAARSLKKTKETIEEHFTSDFDTSDTQEDTAAIELVKFLAQSRTSRQSKRKRNLDKYAGKFKTIVNERERALLDLLEWTSEEWFSRQSKRLESLTSSIFDILDPSLIVSSDMVGKFLTPGHPKTLRDKTSSLVTDSNILMNKFHEVSKSVSSNQDLLQVKGWDKDYQKLSSLLDIGMRATDEKVQRLLGNDEGAKETISTASSIWAEFAKSSNSEDQVEGWGKVARRIAKGIQRLMKNVPSDAA